AALATGTMLLLAFGIAIGAGIVRYTEPDRPAGAPTAASTPLTPPPARITGGGGTPGARRAVTPEILQGMLQAARASLFEGRYGEAIAADQAVLKRDPKNVDAAGVGRLDHAARVRMARHGWAPPRRMRSASDAAGTRLIRPTPAASPVSGCLASRTTSHT